MAVNIRMQDLAKNFGTVQAVNHIDLEVGEGEILTLLGPSGCGKTTTLRCIAGLERPDSGEVYVGDKLMSSTKTHAFIAPEKRGIGMVFQSYAVWPHMTVGENVAYPLKVRKVKGSVVKEKVLKVLELVGLQGLGDRYATLLSGGQQQRVAVARALVFDPNILLLDEPLSNLDAKLREYMRIELRALQRRLGITTVFVTHDQNEAMSLSDRVVVMNAGRVAQMGSPRDIYEHPVDRFTVDFMGRVNYLSCRVMEASPHRCLVRSDQAGGIEIGCPSVAHEIHQGDEVVISVRPEDIQLEASTEKVPANSAMATIKVAGYLGEKVDYLVQVGDMDMRVTCPPRFRFEEGSVVCLTIPPASVFIWPKNA